LVAVKPPIEFFRELLAMNRDARKRLLASRPAESQKLITAKLAEYEALSPDQRELRLRVTELRYYLLPLMSSPATDRSASLARIPAEVRVLVEERLARWDELPPAERKELLENQAALQHLAEFPQAPALQSQVLTNMPAQIREKLLENLRQWEQLPDQQRQVIARRFESYFGLTPVEKAKTLRTLAESERLQIQKTLQTFDRLDPIRRAQCVRALDKLAEMNASERQQFLKSAAQWQRLSPAERASWRNLVYSLSHQPPLPPGLRFPGPPPPPIPRAPRTAPLMATNQ